MNFLDFLAWEEKTRDTVDFKTAYVDMTAFTEEDAASGAWQPRPSWQREG